MNADPALALPRANHSSLSVRDLLWVVAAVTGIEFIETGMVTFAAAPIMGGLGIDARGFAMAWTVYGVGAIFMLYKHQWMVERIGYRNFILASLGVFALGALLCATAGGPGQFTVGRALQGAAGATFFTAGRMQINRLPETARFSGLLTFIGTLLGGAAIAPALAAGLMAAGGWQAVFWVMLPLAAGLAAFLAPRLPRDTVAPEARSREHWGWLIGLVVAVFALQYSIQALQFSLFSAPRPVLATAAVAIAALTLFAARQWRREHPLIDYRRLFQQRYLLGILFYFCGYFLIGLGGFLMPILFQHGLGLDMGSTAWLLTGAMSCSVLAALAHASLARHWPRLRPFMLIGLALICVGNLWLGLSAGTGDWRSLILPALLTGLALPLYMGPVAFGTFVRIDPAVFSHAYQVKNIVRQLGLSSAITSGSVLLEWRYAAHRAPGSAPGEWTTLLHDSLATASTSPTSAALAQACADAFTAGGALAGAIFLVVAFQRAFR